jgi:hypothetical protein
MSALVEGLKRAFDLAEIRPDPLRQDTADTSQRPRAECGHKPDQLAAALPGQPFWPPPSLWPRGPACRPVGLPVQQALNGRIARVAGAWAATVNNVSPVGHTHRGLRRQLLVAGRGVVQRHPLRDLEVRLRGDVRLVSVPPLDR